MSGRWLVAFAAVGACTVSIDDYSQRACDADHPCAPGVPCLGGFCSPDGGAAGSTGGAGGGSAGGAAGGGSTAGGGGGGPRADGGCFGAFAPLVVPDAGLAVVSVGNETPGVGMGDPSLAMLDDGRGVLTYLQHGTTPSVALAVTLDRGAVWSLLPGEIARSAPVVVENDAGLCGGACDGGLTPVFNAVALFSDSATRLFTNDFFSAAGLGDRPEWGYVAMYRAAPDGGLTREKVFGWTSSSPISSEDAGLLLNTLPGLGMCRYFVQPSALAFRTGTGESLDLTLLCASGTRGPFRTILLRSANRGTSWSLVNPNVLTSDELSCLPARQPYGAPVKQFAGADGGRFISLTANDDAGAPRECLVARFVDVQTGALARDPLGRLLVEPQVADLSACSWHPALGARGLFGTRTLNGKPAIVRTGVMP